MIESIPFRWILLLMLTGAALWFLFRGAQPVAGGAPPSRTDRISHLAHALMAVAMAAMIWPMGGMEGP